MQSKPQLILGSKSPYRKALMENAGLDFRVITAAFDEDGYKTRNPRLNPRDLCLHLAEQKALSVAQIQGEDFVIGSDQLIELDSEIIGKSGNLEKARHQLKKMSGRMHRLHTSLALVAPGGALFKTVRTTEITLRPLTPEIIDSYLGLEQPFDCAGSYKMEKAGLLLVETMRCTDPSAIQGLSLMDLTDAFAHFGKSLQDFWKESF